MLFQFLTKTASLFFSLRICLFDISLYISGCRFALLGSAVYRAHTLTFECRRLLSEHVFVHCGHQAHLPCYNLLYIRNYCNY